MAAADGFAPPPAELLDDPLRDLDVLQHELDGDLWEYLLSLAWPFDGWQDERSLFGLMRGMRAIGCTLRCRPGRWDIMPPEDLRGEMIAEWAGDQAPRIRQLLDMGAARRDATGPDKTTEVMA